MKRQKALFLKENYVLRVLKNFMMAGLFVMALLLILVHKIDLGVVSGVSKGLFYITAPIMHTITLPADGISLAYKKTSEIMNVYKENKHLKKQNKQLFLLKDRMKAIKAENKLLKELLHHFDIPEIKTTTARVIAETGDAFANALIIYLGDHASEVKPGYAVVDAHGLIGRIDLISGKYARVSLITDINSKIPVISAISRDRGILTGTNNKELKLIFTPLLAELNRGDLLLTSGVGGGLPPDIPIARIKKIEMDSITALPLFDPSKVEIVKILFYDVMPSPEELKELQ
ncbi:MAG: rod shape-determining protein MreC [Alphaproteobacteria bacterium]|nr:rod shape-determining protein MreC [Alphaproteobacteria bacterium]